MAHWSPFHINRQSGVGHARSGMVGAAKRFVVFHEHKITSSDAGFVLSASHTSSVSLAQADLVTLTRRARFLPATDPASFGHFASNPRSFSCFFLQLSFVIFKLGVEET